MRVNEEHVTHPNAAFRYLQLELPGFGGPRHRHAQAELTWVQHGQGVRFVGDSAEPFDSGDLVLLGPQVPHLWSGTCPAGSPSFRAVVVQFPVALFGNPQWPELADFQTVLDRAAHGLAVQGHCQRLVTPALADMDAADAIQRLATLLLLVRHFLLHPQDLRPLSTMATRASARVLDERRIDRVTDWIAQNLAEELSLPEAAAVAHVSPAAFSRFFKRETGKTWSTYVNDVRCSEAGVRLRQSARPVAELAAACGYRNLSHFNREFVARFGKTPLAYRKA